LSRYDALSFSDIEYGLLREKNLAANHAYFVQLMILFHIQVKLVRNSLFSLNLLANSKVGKSDGYRIDAGGHPLTILSDGVERFQGKIEV
jgi:hypothetical protein